MPTHIYIHTHAYVYSRGRGGHTYVYSIHMYTVGGVGDMPACMHACRHVYGMHAFVHAQTHAYRLPCARRQRDVILASPAYTSVLWREICLGGCLIKSQWSNLGFSSGLSV